MTAAAQLVTLAAHVGACVRPVMYRVTDVTTGEARVVSLPCGATLATSCPSCAERARALRVQQCREGWHLVDDPLPQVADEPGGDDVDEADDQADDDELEDARAERLARSTRRRQDMPDLPALPVEARTIGHTFTGNDGKSYRPSTFLTVTMPSYGPVREDGTPLDPERYDYRRAALDAMHMPKLWDRLVQNLRRTVGYRVQYFAAVEPQKRLAPHVHAALRGAMPRTLIRQVLGATYHQLWWPALNQPIYTDPDQLPVWVDGRYVDPVSGAPLPSWDDAIGRLEEPAYVLRFGRQHDVQGLIAGPKADKRIGYLTKYLTKSIAQGAAPDGHPTDPQQAHARRLHQQVRYLPCSPVCPNWLRYGITPAHPAPGLQPGYCTKRAHRPDRLGCGGRRVLVSRYWTGKTLSQHRIDRRDAVRQVLAAVGVELPDGNSATETSADGRPRWRWERVTPRDDDAPTYRTVIRTLIDQRLAWREQYEHARDRAGPRNASNSATASVDGSDHDVGPGRVA